MKDIMKSMSKKKRKKVLFVTLFPTRIEVTGFNALGSRIHDDEGHALDNGHRYIEGNKSNSGVGQYNLDNKEAVA
jgi:hypothetical protein